MHRRESAPRACTPKGCGTPERSSGYDLGFRATTSKDFAEILSIVEVAIQSYSILEVKKNSISEDELWSLTEQGKRPVVFRGYAKAWPCVKEWNKPGVVDSLAEEEDILFPHRKYRTFFAEDEGRLHLTDGKSKARFLSLKGFLEAAKIAGEENVGQNSIDSRTLSRQNSNTSRARSNSRTRPGNTNPSAYLLGIHDWRGQSTFCPVQRHPDDPPATLPPLAKFVPAFPLVDFYSKHFGASYDHQQFFLTKGYAYTDLHYDSYDNFYVAVCGKRRWTLAPPSLSRWLVEASGGSLKSGSQAIPHRGFYGEHPVCQLFPYSCVELEPGDVLFVPATWWHLVESIPGADGFSCAFNYFFSRDPDVVMGQVAEVFRKWENRVSSRQAECRAAMAGNLKYAEEFPGLRKPKGMSESCFGVLKRVLTVCGKIDWIDRFLEIWEADNILMQQPTVKDEEVKTPRSGGKRTPRKKHEELFFSPQETPVKGGRAIRRE
jgi:hypothetical protein